MEGFTQALPSLWWVWAVQRALWVGWGGRCPQIWEQCLGWGSAECRLEWFTQIRSGHSVCVHLPAYSSLLTQEGSRTFSKLRYGKWHAHWDPGDHVMLGLANVFVKDTGLHLLKQTNERAWLCSNNSLLKKKKRVGQI